MAAGRHAKDTVRLQPVGCKIPQVYPVNHKIRAMSVGAMRAAWAEGGQSSWIGAPARKSIRPGSVNYNVVASLAGYPLHLGIDRTGGCHDEFVVALREVYGRIAVRCEVRPG